MNDREHMTLMPTRMPGSAGEAPKLFRWRLIEGTNGAEWLFVQSHLLMPSAYDGETEVLASGSTRAILIQNTEWRRPRHGTAYRALWSILSGAIAVRAGGVEKEFGIGKKHGFLLELSVNSSVDTPPFQYEYRSIEPTIILQTYLGSSR